METAIMSAMCRCCASEGVFKDVKSSYTWMGDEEVYADMLRECFDITLSTSDHCEDGGICEVCITQLRNASNFKKQVLHTEEQFKKHVNNKLFKPSIVKVEVSAEEDIDSDDNNMSAEEAYSGPEYEIPIKTETEEPKPKKRAAASKATTSRAKKAKTESGESSTKRIQAKVVIKTESKYIVPSLQDKEGSEKGKAVKEAQKYKKTTYGKHLHNLKEILKCTNATPILKQGGIGYMCSFCSEQYPKPEDLKSHTLAVHQGQTNVKISCTSSSRGSLYRYAIRLDITGLKCTLCESNIDSLENLMLHLEEKHEKVIYKDIRNHIVPFKFDTALLTCCLCTNTFERFKILQEHMHKHYRNYICEVCDAGFINKGSLCNHAYIHLKGTFPCTLCSKIFDTVAKKKMHIRYNHSDRNVINRCGYCNEGFREHYMKLQHLAKVHGVHNADFKCNACDKMFSTSNKLRTHVKKDHLLERHHNCSLCDMKFYRQHDLNQHMIKHTGIKKFQCEICLKSYGRKKTLKEHMRIHNGDRRFKCEHCGQAFVQKCSWKAHMKNRHGEIVS